jgi:hypothetical protein
MHFCGRVCSLAGSDLTKLHELDRQISQKRDLAREAKQAGDVSRFNDHIQQCRTLERKKSEMADVRCGPASGPQCKSCKEFFLNTHSDGPQIQQPVTSAESPAQVASRAAFHGPCTSAGLEAVDCVRRHEHRIELLEKYVHGLRTDNKSHGFLLECLEWIGTAVPSPAIIYGIFICRICM